MLAIVTAGGQLRNVIGTADAANQWCNLIYMTDTMACDSTPNFCVPEMGEEAYQACIAAYNAQVGQCHQAAFTNFRRCLGYPD